ncbi:uncharacterized protein LY89DRAFT_664954 [Mollisia scopiformis]|uniref:Uncharacterized protein n=1 Tax=Mollisia scopiformis TaxID=149040 RepID=A0A194XPW6_MOLSC|nr:uncharacterized protein LY89DRAFT_664954 [Mollisia scopiformis]KUJ21787.1 hypothetical protein LY89DRAFT_664954 [Mollisia scopiformis]
MSDFALSSSQANAEISASDATTVDGQSFWDNDNLRGRLQAALRQEIRNRLHPNKEVEAYWAKKDAAAKLALKAILGGGDEDEAMNDAGESEARGELAATIDHMHVDA